MLFNSIEFLFFLPIVFVLYWFVANKNLKAQNLLILVASYVFYGWWDWRFLSLIALSTLVDYWIGIRIQQSEKRVIRRTFLWISMGVNLGLLGFFKYYNFFVESWAEAWAGLGYEMDPWTLNIILPVGISFYTFQTMSYSIDIYRRKLEPTRDFIAFAAFVSFFPQLVAGPIERASNLLPQILKKRQFQTDSAIEGIGLIIWGFFKKVVVADNLALAVNDIFGRQSELDSGTLILGSVYFAFQIYGDFSGYSDIAIGTARLFGINLMTNFRFPYFSRDIPEFWRRWHISLSTWFRDYLYIPLGGSKVGKLKGIRNVFVIFLVSGFWHGANWTFIIWGGIHAFLFLPQFILGANRKYSNSEIAEGKLFPSLHEVRQLIFTFILVCISWIFFRSNSVDDSFEYITRSIKFSNIGDFLKYRNHFSEGSHLEFLFIIIIFIVFEYYIFKNRYINFFLKFLLLILIAIFGNFVNQSSFIYFQF